jgi:hypothetical protein
LIPKFAVAGQRTGGGSKDLAWAVLVFLNLTPQIPTLTGQCQGGCSNEIPTQFHIFFLILNSKYLEEPSALNACGVAFAGQRSGSGSKDLPEQFRNFDDKEFIEGKVLSIMDYGKNPNIIPETRNSVIRIPEHETWSTKHETLTRGVMCR